MSDPVPIGPKSRAMLAEVGITSLAALKQLGAGPAFRALRFRFGRHVTRNMLWGLEQALTGTPWNQIAQDRKAALLKEAGETNDAA